MSFYDVFLGIRLTPLDSMTQHTRRLVFVLALVLGPVLLTGLARAEKPNVILIFSDDISAREIPIYGSTVWSDLRGGDTRDPALRARTPVMDRIAEQGVWITTPWSATICMPSRATLMSGRFPSIHKWWHNRDIGGLSSGDLEVPRVLVHHSSPLLIGHVAQQAGYASMWCGKIQMLVKDAQNYGFDEVVDTPGQYQRWPAAKTDFYHQERQRDGERVLLNADTGEVVDTYKQLSWLWYPAASLIRHPTASGPYEQWPNTPEAEASYGVNTYGPDVELDFIFDFIERQHEAGKPFFVYHTSHLGHDAFNWLDPDSPSKWPHTPKLTWHDDHYHRTEPNITGDDGAYEFNGTLAGPGMHRHVEYLDYQVWRYLQKLKELGIENDTVLIFTSDNGTSGFGKGMRDRQKGPHVPLIVYAPGQSMTKTGEQDILVSLADFLPTLADVMGYELPGDYEVHGESFWPYLTTDAEAFRPWVYSWWKDHQFIRGDLVLRDARGAWWDVSETPDDLDGYPRIEDWSQVSEAHRRERDALEAILPRFDLYDSEHDLPELADRSVVE
ncbi:MAG: sulfatase-like hydrolase/transferase [Planctomycetota bacterium]